jgi:hypothetical protein
LQLAIVSQSSANFLEVDLQFERVPEVDCGLLGDVLDVLDLEVLGVVVRVFEDQLLAVQIDLGTGLELALVVEERVVGVHQYFALLGVELIGETELHSHQAHPTRILSNH